MKNTIHKYCDIGLNKKLFTSYAQIARVMGISPSGLTMLRKGSTTATENTLIELAKAVGEDPLDVITEYKIENAKTDNVVDFWQGMRNTAAALALFMLVQQGTTTQNIYAEEDLKSTMVQSNILYIMLSNRYIYPPLINLDA